MKVTLPHVKAGKVDVVGSPMNFSDSKIEYKLPPPMVGQQSDEILKSIGYDDAKIKALREKKIV
jgi:formyl-CoA transferase/CoA:oxalate CoA-transferase